ncbi:MAG: outer membrane beta-barrel protein [Verrucomicrobia bacterium]|nr:outer membrane beta-barrel protein [Verrucomicrobiota bacterium]
MKLNKWTVALAAAGLVSLGQNAQAEEAGNAVMTAFSKTTLSGFVDTSLSISEKGANQALHGRVPYQSGNKMNGINLDVIQLSLASPLDESDWAAGYAVDLLFGPDASAYSVSGTGEADDVAVRQAYVNTRVPVGNGLDLKMGVFDAIIGYEGFSNRDNPNYSRNMAYNLQPFNHTGLLGGYQINDLVSAQFGVANTGSNVLTDRAADSSDISYMGSIAVEAPENFGALAGATVYVGYMEFGGGGDVQQNLYVGSTIPTPIDGLALGAAWDNVQNITGNGGDANILAGYISYQATDKMAVNGRIEYLDGDQGVLFNASKNGVAVDSEMLSLTGTVQYDLWDNVLTRAEVRWDSQEDGDGLYGGDDDILTFTLNAIYSF